MKLISDFDLIDTSVGVGECAKLSPLSPLHRKNKIIWFIIISLFLHIPLLYTLNLTKIPYQQKSPPKNSPLEVKLVSLAPITRPEVREEIVKPDSQKLTKTIPPTKVEVQKSTNQIEIKNPIVPEEQIENRAEASSIPTNSHEKKPKDDNSEPETTSIVDVTSKYFNNLNQVQTERMLDSVANQYSNRNSVTLPSHKPQYYDLTEDEKLVKELQITTNCNDALKKGVTQVLNFFGGRVVCNTPPQINTFIQNRLNKQQPFSHEKNLTAYGKKDTLKNKSNSSIKVE